MSLQNVPFRITGLPVSEFQPLFDKTPNELAGMHAMRMVVDKKPGYPCRVSLADAEVGEEVLLIHYEHQKAGSPFRASHAVFVRPGATESHLDENEVPVLLRTRVLSLRAFDEAGMMVTAQIVDGNELESALDAMLSDYSVAYIHIHFAKAGCYAARVDRT